MANEMVYRIEGLAMAARTPEEKSFLLSVARDMRAYMDKEPVKPAMQAKPDLMGRIEQCDGRTRRFLFSILKAGDTPETLYQRFQRKQWHKVRGAGKATQERMEEVFQDLGVATL